jgi:mono/diheme cytochrome c family protein
MKGTGIPAAAAKPRILWAASLLAPALALALSYGLSLGLRHAQARSSHQQPTAEAWLETAAPSTPALVAEGRKLFLGSCAHCHGADATGDEGPDLHAVEVSDRYIAHIITHGIKHEMPSFAKKLGAAEIAKLTAYVRSLD